ncbi:MAG: SEL1-like repeat protein [Pirellulaceae bacterium]|nr:SEL1-like repeat protein [Pirellulaceae bacterium]
MADLRTVHLDDVLVVYFPDHELMDEEQNRRIGAELIDLTMQANGGKMLVSFRGVDFVTSSMLGQLVMLNKRCLSHQIGLKICDVGPDLRMIFRIVRLDTLVDVCGDEASALQAFRTGRPKASKLDDLDTAADYQAAADAGDAAAQFALGKCYEEGRGVDQNFHQALHWYEKAAALGHAGAQHTLGNCFAYGMDVPPDYDRALVWYRKAAEQGHANSQYLLGVSYAHGLAGVQDHAVAAQWYLRAAEAGDLEAQVILAESFLEGRGLDQDDQQGVRWMRTAAERGHADAQANLGWIYAQGEIVEKDLEEAIHWYTLAAKQGHQAAQQALDDLDATEA